MGGTHDAGLVVLSVLIAMLASYTALDLANSVPGGRSSRRVAWLVAGSLAMGIGIWSMHFIAMLAFNLPHLTIAYERGLLLASILVAVLASFLALITISRPHIATSTFVTAGLLMGVAIAGMHYTGMAALRTGATIRWNIMLVVVSIWIAIAASLVALALALRVRRSIGQRAHWLKLGGGAVMGLAIAGMHYTAMAAARFVPLSTMPLFSERDVIATRGLVLAVTASSTLVLVLAIGGMLITREIARRTELITRIRQSEEYFRALIEHASELVTVVDAQGNRKFVSPSYERLLGYTPAELIGKNAFALLHPDDMVAAREAFGEVQRTPNAIARVELRVRHRDGGWRTLTVTGQNLLENPAVRGIVMTAQDDTERRRLEADFQQAQKMEAVGKLAGGIAHDFNNLLTVIIGNAEWLQQDSAPVKERQARLGEVRASAERAAALTRQLLAYSRRQMLQPRVINLNEVVAGMEKMLARLLGEDIRIVADLEPKLGSVRADPGQVEQAIMNLAVNSRDAMPRGGTLRLTTRNVRDPAVTGPTNEIVPPGDYVAVTISDTGTGIDPATMPRIFEPFFTTKEVGQGTGLGLSTVYGIMKQTGGYVIANSAVARGCEFTLFFECCTDPEKQRLASLHPNGARHGHETVLLVEDEAVVRELVDRVLTSKGYCVLPTAGSADALQYARAHDGPIHLLLTDVVLPGLSGREIADQITTLRPEVRLLFMSGYTEDEVLRRGVFGNAANFLQKPFTSDKLLQTVREVLA